MESIILFALIAIGSTVIKAVKKDAERQRNIQTAPKHNIPNMQMNTNTNMGIQSNIIQGYDSNNGNNMYEDNILTEVLNENVPQKSSSRVATPVNDSGMAFINYDELQRSIVMAEVLGKPKAFKRSIR